MVSQKSHLVFALLLMTAVTFCVFYQRDSWKLKSLKRKSSGFPIDSYESYNYTVEGELITSPSLGPTETSTDDLKPSSTASPPFNEQSVQEIQRSRKNRINEVCTSLQNGTLRLNGTIHYGRTIDGHGNFYQSKELNAIMCSMAKAGTTSILWMLCWAIGPKCTQKTTDAHRDVPKFLRRLQDPALRDTENFTKYFLFTTVRNPWRRLVSTYVDKCVNTNGYKNLCSVNARWSEFDKKKKLMKERWTFREFIEKCVIYEWDHGGPRNQNNHWKPQNVLGSFCAVDYAYIGALETMAVDLVVITHRLGLIDGNAAIQYSQAHRRPWEKNNETINIYEKSWATIDPVTLDRLRVIYALDFIMFDYPTDP